MANGAANVDRDLQQTLSLSHRLARRVRTTQRATWFPLLVLAAATYLAIAVYRFSPTGMTCRVVPPLAGVGVAYLAIVLVPIDFGWVISGPTRWVVLPHLIIQGSVLLLAGIGFAVAQHRFPEAGVTRGPLLHLTRRAR